MIKNNYLAGLVAGVILALIFTVYLVVRGDTMARLFQEDSDMANLSQSQMHWILVGMFVGGALLWGLGAGLVYSWLNSADTFRLATFSAAVILSVVALVSKTPLVLDKIFMNFAVAASYGFLLPWLTG
ncbi:MAG: hypothetical protein PVF49_03440 [Anaerolineales bacterium]|jgi:hypothetical protein